MRTGLIILGDLKDQDLIWMSRNGDVIKRGAGDVLITGGQEVSSLFIVLGGDVDVIVGDGTIVASLSTGDVIGEMSLIENRPPSADVVCRGDCRFLAVPRETLTDELRANDGFAARFYRALAVFLSTRLRTQTLKAGDDDEIDERLLDNLHVAGDRMLRLMALLEGRA